MRLDETIVGYIPREKSCVMWYITEHDGVVTCQLIN